MPLEALVVLVDRSAATPAKSTTLTCGTKGGWVCVPFRHGREVSGWLSYSWAAGHRQALPDTKEQAVASGLSRVPAGGQPPAHPSNMGSGRLAAAHMRGQTESRSSAPANPKHPGVTRSGIRPGQKAWRSVS